MSRNFQAPQYQTPQTGMAAPPALAPAQTMKPPGGPPMSSGPKMVPQAIPTMQPPAPAPMAGVGFVRPRGIQQ